MGKQLNRYQANLIQDGTERTQAWATFMDEKGDKNANHYEKEAPDIRAGRVFVLSGTAYIHAV